MLELAPACLPYLKNLIAKGGGGKGGVTRGGGSLKGVGGPDPRGASDEASGASTVPLYATPSKEETQRLIAAALNQAAPIPLQRPNQP